MKAPPWVWLAAMAVVAGAHLVPPGVSSSRDYVLLHSLNRQYWADAVHHLRLPLWNPHVGLGRPFLADIETTTLYPTTLLYLFGPAFGLAASLFLHFVLAGLGMRAFARRLGIESPVADIMAIAFLLSGPMAVRLLVGQIGFTQALCYLPLAFAQAVAVQDTPGARSVVSAGPGARAAAAGRASPDELDHLVGPGRLPRRPSAPWPFTGVAASRRARPGLAWR